MESRDAIRVLRSCRTWQPRPGYFPKPIEGAGEEDDMAPAPGVLPVHSYMLPGSTEAEQAAYCDAEAVLCPLQHVRRPPLYEGPLGHPDEWREWLQSAREALNIAAARAIANRLANRKGKAP